MTSSQPAAAGVDINPLHAPCFGEVLIDSRIVAQNLDSGQHRSLFRLTKRHEVRLRRIRIPRFEVAEIKGRGQPERYTLLNEDQTDLLTFLSFNPPQACDVKRRLIQEKDSRLFAFFSRPDFLR